jgi:hypothetical protein
MQNTSAIYTMASATLSSMNKALDEAEALFEMGRFHDTKTQLDFVALLSESMTLVMKKINALEEKTAG